MVRIVLDAELRAKLRDVRDSAEIVDEDGELFAVVTRANGGPEVANGEPPIRDYERPPYDGRRSYSSEEVLKRLRAR